METSSYPQYGTSITVSNKFIEFQGECILTAGYLINRTLSILLTGKSPYEVLFGQNPSYQSIRAFRCLCYSHNLTRGTNLLAEVENVSFQGIHMIRQGGNYLTQILRSILFLVMWCSLKLNFHLMRKFPLMIQIFIPRMIRALVLKCTLLMRKTTLQVIVLMQEMQKIMLRKIILLQLCRNRKC